MGNFNISHLIGRLKQHRLTAAWAGAIAIILLVMYSQVGAVFVRRWFSDSSQYHCVLVPFLVGWFIWRRWPALKTMRHRPSLAGFALLGFGLLLYWASARTGTRLLAGVAFPVIIAGLTGAVYGREALALTAAPFALLVFAIPIPEHAIGMIAMPMQRVSAVITGSLSPLLGLEVIQQGVNLDMNGFTFVVAEECSGMRSLVALLLTGFVLVELSGLSRNWRAATVAIIPLLVLFANVTRLLFVLLLGHYFGPDFALGFVVHGVSDVIVYGAAVISLILIIGWLQDRQRGDTQSPPDAPAGTSEMKRASDNPQADSSAFFPVSDAGSGE